MVKHKYVEGTQVTYKNGAIAIAQPNGMLKIISGPTKGSKRKKISKSSAKRAFNKYWNTRAQSVRGNKLRSRGVASARARDIKYGTPRNLRSHSGYKQNPGRLEYEDVDYGTSRYNVTAKSIASGEEALRIHRSKKNRGRGRPSNISKITGRNKSALGMKGSACKKLSKKDCGRHPACNYVKEYSDKNGRKIKAHCGRKQKGGFFGKSKKKKRKEEEEEYNKKMLEYQKWKNKYIKDNLTQPVENECNKHASVQKCNTATFTNYQFLDPPMYNKCEWDGNQCLEEWSPVNKQNKWIYKGLHPNHMCNSRTIHDETGEGQALDEEEEEECDDASSNALKQKWLSETGQVIKPGSISEQRFGSEEDEWHGVDKNFRF